MIQEASFAASTDKLIFHEKTGTLVKLTNGRRTAERRRPLDEFNNGVVMTARPIKDDEMFEVCMITFSFLIFSTFMFHQINSLKSEFS